MELEPKGRKRKVTDGQLRQDLADGLKPGEIAKKHGVSAAAISKRLKVLSVSTVAAVAAPVESQRFAERQIDAMEELQRIIHQANLLGDACDEWLRDPDYPEKYTVEARSGDITVVYRQHDGEFSPQGNPIFTKKRASLESLLARVEVLRENETALDGIRVESWEKKHADPRELILKTAQERRQTVLAAVELMKMLIDSRKVDAYVDALLKVIETVSPDVRDAVVEAVRSHLRLCATLGATAAG